MIASDFTSIRYAVAVDAAGNVFVFDHVSAIASTAIAVQRSVSPPSARVRPSAHGQANTHWRSVPMPSIMLGAQGPNQIIRVTPSGPCSRERTRRRSLRHWTSSAPLIVHHVHAPLTLLALADCAGAAILFSLPLSSLCPQETSPCSPKARNCPTLS